MRSVEEKAVVGRVIFIHTRDALFISPLAQEVTEKAHLIRAFARRNELGFTAALGNYRLFL